MRVRLLKKFDWVKKTIAMGSILEVYDPVAKKMISDGIAEKYTGDYPPKEKMKTDLFKPK